MCVSLVIRMKTASNSNPGKKTRLPGIRSSENATHKIYCIFSSAPFADMFMRGQMRVVVSPPVILPVGRRGDS